MNKQWVVIVGTLFGVKSIHGPFYDWDHVCQWCALHTAGQPYEIVPLLSP